MENYLPQEINGGEVAGALVQVEQSRAMQEVQAAMVIAKRFPRDEMSSTSRVLKECERKSLAEVAQYSYPRGGTSVEGPSIRLAEVMARCWGNMIYGLTELSQANNVSDVEAYAWDLETNTKVSRRFQVPHIRYSKNKGNTVLTDPRDIYEMIANQGQRRVRACILEVIPGDVQDKAIERCNRTLKSAYTEPLEDRILRMVEAFSKIGVTQGAIENRLNHVIAVTTEIEMTNLQKIYTSIKDGMAKREDFFDLSKQSKEVVKERLEKIHEKKRQSIEPDDNFETDKSKDTKGTGAPEEKDFYPPEEKADAYKGTRPATTTEPTPEEKDKAESEAFRDEWINTRAGDGVTTGFAGFIRKNPVKALRHKEWHEEMSLKWDALYPDKERPYPLPPREKKVEQAPPAAEPEKPEPQATNLATAPVVDAPEDNDGDKVYENMMSELLAANRFVYWRVMKAEGFEDPADVPINRREEIYNEISGLIEKEGERV